MSYVIWNLNDSALRRACILEAYYHCGWHREDTLGEIIEQMHREGGTPDDTECFASFCDRMRAIRCGQHLIEAANDSLQHIYSGQLSHEPISIEEILMTRHNVEEWFDEMAE